MTTSTTSLIKMIPTTQNNVTLTEANMNWLYEPWPWYVAGPMLALMVALLIYTGKSFGVSGVMRTMCAASGAGKKVSFFNYNWRQDIWNLMFVLGAVLGGIITHLFFYQEYRVDISPKTVEALQQMGIEYNPGYLPKELFGVQALGDVGTLLVLILGGFMVGFGARYAGGCTSGHAISGLATLQVPSLIAVIGFFIGGLLMTWVFLPILI